MRSYPVRENPISSARSFGTTTQTLRHTNRQTYILLLMYKNYLFLEWFYAIFCYSLSFKYIFPRCQRLIPQHIYNLETKGALLVCFVFVSLFELLINTIHKHRLTNRNVDFENVDCNTVIDDFILVIGQSLCLCANSRIKEQISELKIIFFL